MVRLVRGCESWAADTAEGAIRVDAARVDAEWGGRLCLVTLVDVWGGEVVVQGTLLLRPRDLGTRLPVLRGFWGRGLAGAEPSLWSRMCLLLQVAV